MLIKYIAPSGPSRLLFFCYESITEMLFVTCDNCDDGRYYSPYTLEIDRHPLSLPPADGCTWTHRPGELRMTERMCMYCEHEVPYWGLNLCRPLRHLRCEMCNGYTCCACTYLLGGEKPVCPFCTNLEINYPTGPFNRELERMTEELKTDVWTRNAFIMQHYADIPVLVCGCKKVWIFSDQVIRYRFAWW